MKRSARAVLLATLLAFTACSLIVDPPARPTHCEPDDDDDPCGSGFTCAPSGGGYVCRASECDDSDDCPEDFVCLEHTCLPAQCTELDDCDEGFLCVDGFCIDGQCTKSEDCDLSFYCLENLCVPGCDGPDRCFEGQICFEQSCRSPRAEICNGEDDDYNGEIDDGLDRDGDSYSSCETVSPEPDCDDNNPDVYPRRPEECDGADNDCNGLLDDANACTTDEFCEHQGGGVYECVDRDPDGCSGDWDCESPSEPFCNTGTGRCEPAAELFDICFSDDQCAEGLCIRTDALGTDYVGQYCLHMCCHSDECETGSWCVENGSGFRVCAPDAWFPDRNVTCSDRYIFDVQCQTCWSFNSAYRQLCRPSCCGDTDCGGTDGRCMMVNGKTALAEAIAILVCNAWDIVADRYDLCPVEDPNLCDSGLFWEEGGQCRCVSPCCDDSSCRVSGHESAVCALGPMGFNQCYDPELHGSLGTRGLGDSCTSGSGLDQCASGTCHPNGYCSRPCCPGDPCTGDMACHPVSIGGGRYASLCTLDDE